MPTEEPGTLKEVPSTKEAEGGAGTTGATPPSTGANAEGAADPTQDAAMNIENEMLCYICRQGPNVDDDQGSVSAEGSPSGMEVETASASGSQEQPAVPSDPEFFHCEHCVRSCHSQCLPPGPVPSSDDPFYCAHCSNGFLRDVLTEYHGVSSLADCNSDQ